jgi:hypothetical protein
MPGKLIRVLLVDDSDAFRRSAGRYVSHLGLAVAIDRLFRAPPGLPRVTP